jgi:hypothetical protein
VGPGGPAGSPGPQGPQGVTGPQGQAGSVGADFTIGDNSAVIFTLTHSLDKTRIIVSVREISSGYFVYPDIKYISTNQVELEFTTAPSTNQYFVSIIGF